MSARLLSIQVVAVSSPPEPELGPDWRTRCIFHLCNGIMIHRELQRLMILHVHGLHGSSELLIGRGCVRLMENMFCSTMIAVIGLFVCADSNMNDLVVL